MVNFMCSGRAHLARRYWPRQQNSDMVILLRGKKTMATSRGAHCVLWLTFGVLPVVFAQGSVSAADLIVDSTLLFSDLDGGPDDQDGLADGFLTLSSLTLTDRGEIVLDVPFAEFHVVGGVRLEGRAAIRSTEPLPSIGPTLNILSGQSIVMVGSSAIQAHGTDAGGAVVFCAAGDIDLRGRSATIASSALGPAGVGGSVVLQGGGRIILNSSAARIEANGVVGGSISLTSCSEDSRSAGLAILIKGKIQAIGTAGIGGTIEMVARSGGIHLGTLNQSAFRPFGSIEPNHSTTPSDIEASGSSGDGTITLTAATIVKPDPPQTNPPAEVIVGPPSEASCNCSLLGPLLVTIQSPENQSVTADNSVGVTGQVSGADTVAVNGVEASVVAGTFFASAISLAEGTNVLVATAQNEGGDTATDTVSVRRDTTPPLVVIESPDDGQRLVTETVTVAGTVNDIIPGATTNADDVTVTINGLPAAVNNRTFILPDLPLALGANTITAIAVDRVGNENTSSIQVTREPDLAGIQIVITGGNAQIEPINATLPTPLSVRLQDVDGLPFGGRPVSFEVSRGDGLLNDPGDNLRTIILLADGDGNAAVDFTLGSRTGEGFHRVRVTTPGSLTFAEFCATAEPTGAVNIAMNRVPPNQGVAGQALTDPLSAIVTDEGGNSVPGVEVTFDVAFGGGNLGGAASVVSISNADGVAEADWTLGPDTGVANNEATATFEGNAGFPVTFIVSGFVPGAVEDTKVSGVVQDSTGNPIVGVSAVLRGTELEAFTGADGSFTIVDVPPGGHRVAILGSTANDPANNIFFPDIDFAIEAVSGADNTLDQIVILPFLDVAGAQLAGGDEDVVLTMEGVTGFAIKVFAHSTFVHDPVTGELVQQPLVMSSSQVKFDKLPMPPPQGSTPLVVGTLQPPGVFLDPPAQVVYPNVEGLAPGDVADIFAFHHDIGQFVNIGPGTVSEDGSVVVSDPGFGIVQSGWHCLIRIPGPPANCANKCKGRLKWTRTDSDGKKLPVKSKGPIVFCADNDPNATKERVDVEITFTPSGGTFEGSWTIPDPPLTALSQDASSNPVKATIEAQTTGAETSIKTPTYKFQPPGESEPNATCEVIVDVKVLQVDLDIDSDNGGTITDDDDPIEDLAPTNSAVSPYLCVNNDDDNDDLVQDRFTANMIDNSADANDMLLVRLAAEAPGLANATVRLKALSGDDKVRLFDVTNGIAGATVIALGGNGTTFAVGDLPRTMRLEGILPSTSKRDIRLEATLIVDGTEKCKDNIRLTTAEVDVIIDQNQDGNLVPDRNNSVDFVTLMRKNDRVKNADDLETHEKRNAFFVQVEDFTRTGSEIELFIRSFDRTGTEVDSILGSFGGLNIPKTASGLYQSGVCWVVFESDLDDGSNTLRGVPGGTLRIEYNDDGRVPLKCIREFFIVDISVQGASTDPAFSDTPGVPVVFENNAVDGMPSIAADLTAFNNDQRWRIDLFDPRNPAQADITLQTMQGATNTQRDVVTQAGAPAGMYRLPRLSANVFRGNDVWVAQARTGGARNPAINDVANNITLSALPSAGDRARATYVVTPVGGAGQPGGPINSTCIRDLAIVSVEFDGVQGLNSAATVTSAGSVNLANVAGTETVGFGFDERGGNPTTGAPAVSIFGGPVQAAIITSSSGLIGPIDDDNPMQVNVLPATAKIQYEFLNDTPADVMPTSHTGPRQINIDGDNAGNTRMHARLTDTTGMIMATLGVRVVDPTGKVDVGVFIVDTQTPTGMPFNASTRPANVSGIMDIVNDIWAQDAVRFEVVHTEIVNSGGDVDAAPTSTAARPFPQVEDTDLNGDGILQTVPSMHIINPAEFFTLRAIAQARMTAAGENPNAILLIFVNRFIFMGGNPQGLTTVNAQLVGVANNGLNTRGNVAAHEFGHALNVPGDGINGDFLGAAADDPDTDMDETRHTELMSTPGGPDGRDLETQIAVTTRIRAGTYPQ